MNSFTGVKLILEALKMQQANVCLILTVEILLKVKKPKKPQLLPFHYISVVNTAL